MKPIKKIKLFIIHAILAILASFLISTPTIAATYYVDASNGDDSNNGLSSSTAWKTIAKVNTSTFDPGDSVLFKRGEVWRETLKVPSSGSFDNPIIFTAYGSGSKPIISGADRISTFSAISNGSFECIIKGFEAKPLSIFEDDVEMTEAFSESFLSPGEWHYDSETGRLSIRCFDDKSPSNHIIEASHRNYCVYVWKSYLVFENLIFEKNNHPNRGNVVIENINDPPTNVIISKCEIRYGTLGISLHSGSAGNNIIKDCMIYGNREVGVYGYRNASTYGNETYIRNNTIYNNGHTAVRCGANYWIIENNLIYNNGSPQASTPAIYTNDVGSRSGDWGNHNIIRYNRIYNQNGTNNDGQGILIDNYTSYNMVYYNVVYRCYGAGIDINGSHDVKVYNNTLYGNGEYSSNRKAEIRIGGDPNYAIPYNIEIKNNIAYATKTSVYSIHIDNDSYSQPGIDITNNCWYKNSDDWWYWNNGGGSDLVAWNSKSAVGNDLNSNPLFFDLSKSDFTLQNISPIIDAGIDLGLEWDFDGTNLPMNKMPDVGAFEYRIEEVNAPINFRIK